MLRFVLTTGAAACLAAVPPLLAAEAVPAPALSARGAFDDYQQLQERLYTAQAVALPEGGVTFQRDTATWILETGSVRLAQPTSLGLTSSGPTSSGVVTGLVFEGRGRFQMEVPERVERDQLERLSGIAGGVIDLPFTALVLRTSGELVATHFPPGDGGGDKYEVDRMAAERHDHWLEQRWEDVNARVICGLLTPGDRYLRVAVETPDFGWLTWELDGLRREEVELAHHDRRYGYTEVWVSRRQGPGGEDGDGAWEELFDLRHVTVQADLTEAARTGRYGYANLQPRHARFRTELTFIPRRSGARALGLTLDPWAEVTAVEDGAGGSLPFLRDRIGKRDLSIDKDLYDDSLVVLLDQPLVRGEERRLVVVYEQDVLNYMPGRGWYPGLPDSFLDEHTATLELTVRDKHDVRAMGRRVEEWEEGDAKHQVWEIERPAKMVTFSFAERCREETVTVDGVPEVVAFASRSGVSMRNKAHNVAADVANSLQFYQWLFDSELPVERLYATGIIGGHGQAFDGFLHLAEGSWEVESKGPTELFRAHEVAHQWWGHQVAWESYRDQWLSEAFAEYSAMMFVEATLEDGRELYDQIVATYAGQTLGTLESMSRFVRSWAMQPNDAMRERIGPIALGYRAATGGNQGGYFGTTYLKGAVVLHMLRTLLRSVSRSDDLFISLLRDFQAAHQGGAATTADLQAALEAKAPGDWSWFFDQWVYGTEVPTYTWSHQVGERTSDGHFPLTLEVEQSNVSPGFKMPVPVKLDFGGGRGGQIVVLVDEPHETFQVGLPAKPRKVLFNPDHAVLARVVER